MPTLMPRLLDTVDDWMEAGFPVMGTRAMRIEEYHTDDSDVVRAELPGLDPDKDIKVTVSRGMLTIEAERTEDERTKRHSEFRYGALRRVATLPVNAIEEDIKARYDKGILEVTIPLRKEEESARAIPVESR